MDRLNDELMPISENQWNEGGTEINSQVRLAIMDILSPTTNAYSIVELVAMMSQPDVKLPDWFKDGLKSYVRGTPMIDPLVQGPILNSTLDWLIAHKKIQTKLIANNEGDPVKYYKAGYSVD